MEFSIAQKILGESIIWVELLCAIVALWFYGSLKNSYWKYFSIYLVVVFINEAISKWVFVYFPVDRRFFYDFYAIPIQFLFLYWLYAMKSLQSKKWYIGCTVIYVLSFFPHLFYLKNVRMINSMSYTIGCLLLLLLIAMEFKKQIYEEDILKFKTNKMFYINMGVLLFYIGTLPFFAFDNFTYEHYAEVWSNYLTFFLFAVNFLYLIYIASFIWGKSNT